MNRPSAETVAVVVALTDPAPPGLRARLARFADEAGPLGEVLLVDASGTPAGEEAARGLANVRVISRPAGRLAPLLWRDGLLATTANLVAFTTAQMTPHSGWLGALRDQLLLTNAAGVGGPIEPGAGLSNTDRAVALLRYSSYFPAIHSGVLGSGRAPKGGQPGPHPHASPSLGRLLHVDPPGDNALYRRDRLMAVEAAWAHGFWEVAVHEALRDRGESLAMAGSAVVTFEGGVGLRPMVRQRLGHAWRFGAGRFQGFRPIARAARVLAAPLVPPLLCVRVVKSLRARQMGLRPWMPAGPRLALLASAWAIGEAAGTLTPFAWPRSRDRKRGPATRLTGKART